MLIAGILTGQTVSLWPEPTNCPGRTAVGGARRRPSSSNSGIHLPEHLHWATWHSCGLLGSGMSGPGKTGVRETACPPVGEGAGGGDGCLLSNRALPRPVLALVPRMPRALHVGPPAPPGRTLWVIPDKACGAVGLGRSFWSPAPRLAWGTVALGEE